MVISLNWLKKFTDIDLSADKLGELIGSRLVEVEEVIDLGARYKGVVVAEIKEVKDHPNADKLKVYLADDGGAIKKVERENGLVQVVSGDMTLKTGDKVAWLSPGSSVPSSFEGNGEPFVLGSRDMRGVTSHGMFGSGAELGLNGDSAKVQVLDTTATVGTSFAEAYELNDYLFDIENKSLTHRPDCFGLIGFAREVAAIQGKRFHTPAWLLALKPRLEDVSPAARLKDPVVKIESSELCPRYEAVVLSGLDATKKSPLVIQSYLKRLGMKPINAVVDVTNYLMVVSGQPLHAFDYDAVLKVQGDTEQAKIVVRAAKDGEELRLLDGREIKLSKEDIVICADNTPVALAGAMGGRDTEVNDQTTRVLLESATFNLYNLRGTAMRHGIASDAVTRFTKGQPADQTAPVLASAVRMLCDVAGGQRASEVTDVYPDTSEQKSISVSQAHISSLLGAEYKMKLITDTLLNVECKVDVQSAYKVHVTPPFWRTDLHIPEDIIEEIGRLNGYDTITPTLPKRPYEPVMLTEFDMFRNKVRGQLVSQGANEVLTYSFVHGKLLKSVGQNEKDAFSLVNALSPQLQYYRLSLWPSLLEKAQVNSKAHENEFALFEMNKVHNKTTHDPKESSLPKEHNHLGFIVIASDTESKKYDGAPYYHAAAHLKQLLDKMNVAFTLKPLAKSRPANSLSAALAAPFEPARSAVVSSTKGEFIGVVGEPKADVATSFKLPKWCAGFELDLAYLYKLSDQTSRYTPLSRYPGTERDLCFRVADDVSYEALADAVKAQLEKTDLEWSLEPVDVYQKQKTTKQITVRVQLTDHDATISTERVAKVVDAIVAAAKKELQAKIV